MDAQSRAALVDESLGLAASPAHLKLAACLQRAQDPPHDGEGKVVDVAAFESRDRRLRHPGRRGEVSLAPPAPPTQGPHDQADTTVIHPLEDEPGGFTADRRLLRTSQSSADSYARGPAIHAFLSAYRHREACSDGPSRRFHDPRLCRLAARSSRRVNGTRGTRLADQPSGVGVGSANSRASRSDKAAATSACAGSSATFSSSHGSAIES